jgi:integrase
MAWRPPEPDAPAIKQGSFAWALERYQRSMAWSQLSSATRRQRENIFRKVLETAKDAQLARIGRASIVAGIDRRKDTPSQARHFKDAMRGFFQWATDAGLAKSDPTQGVKVAKPKTDGFHTWTDQELERFEAHWPLGTRERLAYAVMLYTGLRRGDAATLGPAHVTDGTIRIVTQKTGEVVEIPLLQPLADALDAGPVGLQTFISGAAGKPLAKESLGNWFREACDAAGVPGSCHGLRKAAATRMAENGATEAQLEAVFGWRGGRMASLYTRKARRNRMARDGANALLPRK